jgi:outer membrane protein assembly factor BamB
LPLRLKWNVQFQPERLYPAVQPVVASGRACLGTENGNFYALSAADGSRLWKFPAAADEHVGPILHTAAVEAGRVFFASMDGCVYALDAETGKSEWKYESGLRTGFSTAVLLAEGKVFVPNRAGVLFALRQADGQPAWKVDLGCRLLQTPAYNAGRIYVAGMNMVLYALDAQTGRTLWKTEPIPGLACKDYWPVVHRGLVIVRPMGPWEAVAFKEETGEAVPLKIPGGITMNGAVAPPCVDSDGRLVTASGSGWCRVDVASGAIEEISEKKGRGGRGNIDENMIASACRDMIFVMHCEEGNAQFTGCYQVSKKTWTPLHGGPWGNFTSNTQGGGASQAVFAAGAMYHVSLHGLRCFQGGTP